MTGPSHGDTCAAKKEQLEDFVYVPDDSDSDSLPEINTSSFKESSSERMNIIDEQNRAYEESCLIDKEKDRSKEEAARENQIRIELQQRLKEKFVSLPNDGNCVSVRFRLPCGTRNEQLFIAGCKAEELYAYVFSTQLVEDFFTLVMLHPKRPIPFNECICETLNVVVEIGEESLNVFQHLKFHYPISCDFQDIIRKGVEKREKFLKSSDVFSIGVPRVVHRNDIYASVLAMYADENVMKKYPFFVRFDGEKAVDLVGVTRDMFSAFFEVLYLKLFDGSSLFYPATSAAINIDDFRIIGSILSHAYLVSGVLPDRIAFPCLVSVFLNKPVPESLLVDTFIMSLCEHEMKIVNNALITSEFSSNLTSGLINLFSIYGCKEVPNPKNIKQLLIRAASFTFLIRPAAALQMMRQGIPECHLWFWNSISVEEFLTLYNSMSVSVEKVLNLLVEPTFLNKAEEDVWIYLRKCIGNMSVDELRRFLRFATGGVVICVKQITIIFNKVHGLARRPIGHTCSSTLELSTTYSTLVEFEHELKAVLKSADSWVMDSV
jgi:hypothetical protein